MPVSSPRLSAATPADATTLSALAVQVFLDTYAPDGVRPDLAREALATCSADAFLARLREPHRRILLAERLPERGLVGFAEILLQDTRAPAGEARGAELVRLYVQPQAQGTGLGATLLRAAEDAALAAGHHTLWLTAWEGNQRALRFYARCGYRDVGATTYTFEGQAYGNRVWVRALKPSPT